MIPRPKIEEWELLTEEEKTTITLELARRQKEKLEKEEENGSKKMV